MAVSSRETKVVYYVVSTAKCYATLLELVPMATVSRVQAAPPSNVYVKVGADMFHVVMRITSLTE